MTSTKQIEANKANAQKSTGPKTQEGKAHSRRNAWKHGLSAETMVTLLESEDDFELLRAQLFEDYQPQTTLECELVERLAGILWRLRRVPLFEASIIDARQAQLDHDARRANFTTPYRTPQEFNNGHDDMSSMEWSVYAGHAFIQDSVFGIGLGKLARHDAMLMNALTKTLDTLAERKAERGAKRPPAQLKVVALGEAT